MFDLKKFLDDTARNLGNFANDVQRNVGAVTQPQRSAPQPGSTARPQVNQQRPQNVISQRPQPFQRPVRQPQQPAFDPNALFNDIRKNVEGTVKNVGDFTKPIIDGVVDTGVKAANTAAYVPQAVSQVIKENNGLSAPEVAQGRRDLEATLRRSFVPTDTAMGKTNPIDFAKQFTQAGVETANLIPTKGAVTGLANGLSKQAVAKSLMTNAGQAGVLGTANVGNDALQGREITPESLAMNYALPFALGTGSELAGGAVRSGLRTGLVGAQKTAPAVRAVNNRIEQLNPAVKELDNTIAQYQRAFDVEADPVRRAQINQGLADLNAQRRSISQGGYVKNPFESDDFMPSQSAPVQNVPVRPDISASRTPEAEFQTVQSPRIQNTPDPYLSPQTARPELQSQQTPSPIQMRTSSDIPYADNSINTQVAPVQPRITTSLVSRKGEQSAILQDGTIGMPEQQSRKGQLQNKPQYQRLTDPRFQASRNELDRTVAPDSSIARSDLSSNLSGDHLSYPAVSSQQQLQQRLQTQSEAPTTMEAEFGKTQNQSFSSNDATIQGINTKVQPSSRNIPVRNMVRDGDVVVAENVNPKIKKGEKRYTVDDSGNFIEDKKGAHRVFHDDNGHVTGVRIGNEYYSAKDIGDLSTVNGYGSTVATMRRNVERAFDKQTGEKVNKFLVDHQQHQATKLIDRQLNLKSGMQSVADDLGISFKIGRGKAKKVSAAIQDYGEGVRNKQSLVDEFGAEYANKIVNADKWFRNQYDTLLNEMNKELTKYGYDPVPKRENYYTHFQDENVWRKFGLKMQEIRDLASPTMQDADPTAARGKISNQLAGMSEQTKPNKAFNKFALQRKGNEHTADAFGAFERYLNPTLNNIYMTPSITRARVIARALADEADLAGKDANHTIVQMREWANHLAGKSNRFDRPLLDTNVGQKVIKGLGWAQKKAGQNTIVGNLSTAVLQPVVLSQTAGKFGFKNTLLGMMQEFNRGGNSALKQSEFMKRRYANVSNITDGKMDKAREIANLPLSTIEQGVGEITWSAAHNDALSKGLTGKKAIQYADVQTEKTLSGRSIGERPELYRSKAAGPLTMFQLEVNNYWQQLGKEMTKTQAAKAMIAAYGINLLFQNTIGREVGFNPIQAAIDSYEELTSDDKPEDKVIKVGQRLAGEAFDNVPVVPAVVGAAIGEEKVKELFGNQSNVGKFGVSSPIGALVDNPAYLVSPFGGAQVKKTFEAAQALMDGGLKEKDGDMKVQIDSNNPIEATKGLAFGKGSINSVKDYYDSLGQGKGGETKKDLENDKLEQAVNAKSERTKAFKESLSKDDYAIAQMSKKEQEKLVSDGVITKEKLNGLRGYVENKRKELGYDDSKKSKKEDLTSSNDAEYKALKADYDEKIKNNEYTTAQRIKAETQLNKAKIGSEFSKETRDLYGLSKAQLYAYVTSNENGNKILEDVLAYGDRLKEAGINSYNKFRDKNGNVSLATAKKGGGGRKKSGGGKGGRKKGSSYDYAGSLKSLNSLGNSNQKALRSLVRGTGKYTRKKINGGKIS